jgi:tetratricopeptide (TPR) repeat protein
MQESASFWTDIKTLEGQLVKSPDSLCFARLSDVYLKVGLVDDALHVARQGVIKHPRYLSGQRVLALACHAKGLNDEALAALQLVTEALPEDVASQKLLGRLLFEAGDHDAACQAFRTALEFAPDDVECRIELGSLERSAGGTGSILEADEDDDDVIEDLEILEELDILEEDQPESEFPFQDVPAEFDTVAVPHHDPLSTGTLAELYVSQGFIHKALEIYRAILADNPMDRVTAERVVELEALDAGPTESDVEIDYAFEEDAEEEPAFSIPAEEFLQETEPAALLESVAVPALESQHAFADVSWHESDVSPVSPQGVADNALSTLDGWLENIRRIRLCR